jgi:hypothetical protein
MMCLDQEWGKPKHTTWLNKSAMCESRDRMPCLRSLAWRPSSSTTLLVLITLATLLMSLLEKRWHEGGVRGYRWGVVWECHKGRSCGRTWTGGLGLGGWHGV